MKDNFITGILGRKSKVLYLGALIIFVGCGIFYLFSRQGEKDAAAMETETEYKVERGDLKIEFISDGQAEVDAVNLDFPVSGKVKEIYVKVGQQVKKGEIIARLEDEDYRNQLETARANYEKARQSYELELISLKTQLSNLKYQMDTAYEDYMIMTKVQDAYPRHEIDLKKAAYENAKEAYEAQMQIWQIKANGSADVKAAELSYKQAQDNLQKTVLVAPADGKVMAINFEVGETYSPPDNNLSSASAAGNHFALLTNTDKVYVVSNVSETDLGSVSLGQKVEVEFDAFEGEAFGGKVLTINSVPEIDNNGVVTYPVKVELAGIAEDVKTGMTCTLSFIQKEKKNVLLIPNKAVEMVDGKQTVRVKGRDGKIVTKTIVAGLSDGEYAEVISGLNEGDVVIVRQKTASGNRSGGWQ